MVASIPLPGIVTATFACRLIEQVAVKELEETADLRSEVAALPAKIDRLSVQHEERDLSADLT